MTADPLTDFRAYTPLGGPLSTAENDAIANGFYQYVRDNPDVYNTLSPQEQVQYQYLRYVNGEISGNNKDDQIKKVRQAAGMPNEQRDGDQRYILRNKPTAPDRNDGITSGDVFAIGGYNQSDTGKDDGLLAQVMNKSLPGFDLSDISDLPYIDEIAAVADFFAYGIPSMALYGTRVANDEEDLFSLETLARLGYGYGQYSNQASGGGVDWGDLLKKGAGFFGGGGGDDAGGSGMALAPLLALLGAGGGSAPAAPPAPVEKVGNITPYDLENVLGVAGQQAEAAGLLKTLQEGGTLSDEDMERLNSIARVA